jgi:hypothetical protein
LDFENWWQPKLPPLKLVATLGQWAGRPPNIGGNVTRDLCEVLLKGDLCGELGRKNWWQRMHLHLDERMIFQIALMHHECRIRILSQSGRPFWSLEQWGPVVQSKKKKKNMVYFLFEWQPCAIGTDRGIDFGVSDNDQIINR